MVTCMSLAVPEKVQSLARRTGVGLSSFWESISGGVAFSLPVPKCGSEVPSPSGGCKPRMVGGGAQIRAQIGARVQGLYGESLGEPCFFLRARQSNGAR